MDAYLKFEGPELKGDCVDEKHKDWVEVTSWGWGLTMPMAKSRSTGGARTAGQVALTAFTFKKSMDMASPKLLVAMCKGTHFKKVTVEVLRTVGQTDDAAKGEHKEVFCSYELGSVVIEELTPDGGSEEPEETLKLNPGVVIFKYTPMDPKTGKLAQPIPVGWDFILNKTTGAVDA